MASTTNAGLTGAGKPTGLIPQAVSLIPWDPDSQEHIDRLEFQRAQCGWKQGWTETWKSQQRDGLVGLQWVVLNPDHPSTASRLKTHLATYPEETMPLKDTAKSILSHTWVSRDPHLSTFHPIGHVSLDALGEIPQLLASAADGIYSLATFWISDPLQNCGLGGSALKACEDMAVHVLGAKAITIETIANHEVEYDNPRHVAQGRKRKVGPVTNQDWYQRKGYVHYDDIAVAWTEEDPTGKVWPVSAVCLRKDLNPIA